MPSTLIISTVGLVPIYKNRPVLSRSTFDRLRSRIGTKISSKSTCCNHENQYWLHPFMIHDHTWPFPGHRLLWPCCCLTELRFYTQMSRYRDIGPVLEHVPRPSRARLLGIYIFMPHPLLSLHELTRSIWKMLGPFATASRRYIVSHQVSLVARQL